MAYVLNTKLNGLSANDVCKKINTELDKMEKSAFKVACMALYATGATIPSFGDCGEAICEKPISKKDFGKKVDRSRVTISRWCTALRHIIKEGDFDLFNEGVVKFSYDKIILYYENADFLKSLKINTVAEAVSLSTSELKSLIDGETEEENKETEEEEKKEEETKTEEENKETEEKIVHITYLGEDWTIPESILLEYGKPVVD